MTDLNNSAFASVSLAGKVALVTGAGMGMGRATAELLARRGARLVVSDIDEGSARETVAAIVQNGGDASFLRADVSIEGEVETLIETTVSHFGRLDCAVNNAAIAPDMAPIPNADLDRVDRIFAVNLRGVLLCMKYELKQFLAQGGGGVVVNIGSISSARPQAYSAAYNAAKHGVIGLTKTAALESAPQGTRVNAVLPGAIDTPMIRSAREEAGIDQNRDFTNFTLFNRLGRPEEVAEATAWLCSDAASFVTGHSLAVDGGFLAR